MATESIRMIVWVYAADPIGDSAHWGTVVDVEPSYLPCKNLLFDPQTIEDFGPLLVGGALLLFDPHDALREAFELMFDGAFDGMDGGYIEVAPSTSFPWTGPIPRSGFLLES